MPSREQIELHVDVAATSRRVREEIGHGCVRVITEAMTRVWASTEAMMQGWQSTEVSPQQGSEMLGSGMRAL